MRPRGVAAGVEDLAAEIADLRQRLAAAELAIGTRGETVGEMLSENERIIAGVGAGNVTSTTDVTVPTSPTLSVSFTKLFDDSIIIVSYQVSFYATVTAGHQIVFGVEIGAYGVQGGMICVPNELSVHQGWGIDRFVTGIAAGTYTCTLKARVTSGTSTFDANDYLSLNIRERFCDEHDHQD